MKKKFTTKKIAFLFVMMFPLLGMAQEAFFKEVPKASLTNVEGKRVIIPTLYRTLQLDTTSLQKFLRSVPKEAAANTNRNAAPIFAIPMPDGTTAMFHIWETPTMEPGLAARYATIKTYTGQGITDPTATIKIDWTEAGFHAMILSPITTSIFIDPYAQGNKLFYITYFKKDYRKTGTFIELPPIKYSNSDETGRTTDIQSTQCIGTQLRTYRLAVACTGEYAVAATGVASPTKAQALSAIVTTVTRVNGVYEKEIDIRMVLIEREDSIVYTDATTDPFTGNNNANTLINESQTVITARIGSANYDMGHTFSTGGGGLSGLGVICKSTQKASSITGSSVPTGDGYDIDYVAHEMGHALGANHTFNSATSNCSGNGASGTNAEPGSGTTIMAYAGICGADDIQPHSDPQFHAVSLDEISTYTFGSTGNSCGLLTATGNTPPVVDAGANYTIPKLTPFVLTGSGIDANGDALTYSWEEIDVSGPFGTPAAVSGNAPLFRSFIPVTTPTRFFPKLADQLNNATTLGERLPSYARTMRFRLTARDNRAGGGGVCFDSTSLKVDATADPFIVTYPTAAGVVWYVNDFKTVTWNASTTAQLPIGATNVTIQLSLDGGTTYPVTLSASTPNDGTEEIQVPNNLTAQARIRVLALGNVFYDISNSNFTILASPTADFVLDNPVPVTVCGSANASTTLRTGALGGFNGDIALSATGAPTGTSVTFLPASVTPNGTSTVTLLNANTLANGSYSITVSGASAGFTTKTSTLTFIIGGAAMPNLTSPANFAIGQASKPTFTWAAVSGATSYTLEISTLPDFSAITQSIAGITTTTITLTTALSDNTNFYWRITGSNICGLGTPSSAFIFRTLLSVCTSFASTDVPKTISTSGAPLVTSNLIIPAGSATTIVDVDVVGLKGTHTWTSDLIDTLISPAGTKVILFNRVCNSNTAYANFDVNFDSQAADAIPCNFIGGITVLPAQSLTAFNGQSNAGTWIMKLKDAATGDGGSLNGWGLRFCSTVATPVTYVFTGNGNWSNAANWLNGAIPPATLPINCAIEINPIAGGECLLDVTEHISTGATLTVKAGKIIQIPGSLIIQ